MCIWAKWTKYFLIWKELYRYRFHQTCLCFHIQNIYQYSIFFYWKKHSRGVIYILKQYSVSKSYSLKLSVTRLYRHIQGRIQDFKLGGAHLKFFFGYFVWKITILRHKIIFFPILGGARTGCAPPGSAPDIFLLV